MILFGDFQFFIYMIIAAMPAIVLGVMGKTQKYYTMAVSLVFVWLSMGSNMKALAYLAFFCLFQLGLLKLWLHTVKKIGRNGGLYIFFLFMGMAPLILNKLSGTVHMSVFGFIGISYMTFKVLQMIIEIYDGLIEEIPLLNYFSLLLFFPSFLSGPIDRSRRYDEDLNTIRPRQEYLNLLGEGLWKILKGMLYKFVLAATMYQAILWLGMKHTMSAAFIYMYSYGFYLFFDFAGYSLMAIGCAYIFGIRLPENFKLPFLSKDIAEFWNRWHITLSHWFRDYLFSRLMMRWIKNKRFKKKLNAACCGFMVNMTVMGLWHGLTSYYILYGLYHGALLATTEIWQKKSPLHKKYKKEKWYIAVSIIITFNLVMFGLFIFSGRFTELLGLWFAKLNE